MNQIKLLQHSTTWIINHFANKNLHTTHTALIGNFLPDLVLEDVPGLRDALVAGSHEVPHPRLHALLHRSTNLEEDQGDLTGQLLENYSKLNLGSWTMRKRRNFMLKLMGRLKLGKPGEMPLVPC